jgi:hypothetical protein
MLQVQDYTSGSGTVPVCLCRVYASGTVQDYTSGSGTVCSMGTASSVPMLSVRFRYRIIPEGVVRLPVCLC